MNIRVIFGSTGRASTRLAVLGALIGATAAGCSGLPVKKTANATPDAENALAEHQSAPRVNAVRLESATADGQTSWQIEPVASWMPQVPGTSGDVPPHIQERLKYAFDLAQRGATYSAQQEFQSVLDLCAVELDAKEGGTRRRTAFREGLTAIEEAGDFVRGQSVTDVSVEVSRIASSHRTPLQKQLAAQSMDSRAAVQSYYAFAEERFAAAYQGASYTTLPLYGLGRTSAALGDTSAHSALTAMLMHHVALQVNPANSLAANELGVLLAHNGRYREAEQVLRKGVEARATPEIWQNLAVVCDRLGKSDESKAARQQVQAIADAGSNKEKLATVAAPVTVTAPVTVAAKASETRSRPGSISTVWKSWQRRSQRPLEKKDVPLMASKAPVIGVSESILK